MGRSLMVIFSVGGLGLTAHGKGGLVRCQPAVISLVAPPHLVLDPFPAAGTRGVVGDGLLRLERGDGRGDVEVASRSAAVQGRRVRWDDLDLLGFCARTLFGWIVLPTLLTTVPDDPALTVRELAPTDGLRRLEVTVAAGWAPVAAVSAPTRHVLHVDGDGRVHRHEEGSLVHELSGHCDFGDGTRACVVATHRRTWTAGGSGRLPMLWADVVAAHPLPTDPPNCSIEGTDVPTTHQ